MYKENAFQEIKGNWRLVLLCPLQLLMVGLQKHVAGDINAARKNLNKRV